MRFDQFCARPQPDPTAHVETYYPPARSYWVETSDSGNRILHPVRTYLSDRRDGSLIAINVVHRDQPGRCRVQRIAAADLHEIQVMAGLFYESSALTD